ncbi:MAG TPA: 30S ribosomal protein S17 [Solirubrobacteraceae bacterium]|nr:30S ribosomal protein S17 [Solirubrobacteraceae bacterium]
MAETENNENETAESASAEAPLESPAADSVTESAGADSGATSEPVEVVPPKERRRRSRAAKAAQTKARKALTPEERQAERAAERGRKAQARRVERTRSREKARAARAAGAGEGQATPPREHGPGRQKTRQGVVVSDKADKTITVRIDVARRHRRYEKIVRVSNTLHAHDESNDAHIGDTVIVRECRPMSRLKRWRLIQVVERAE